MTTNPNPLTAMRARTNRLLLEATTPAATFTSAGRIAAVGVRLERTEAADEGHYIQPSTGAYLTVGDVEQVLDWRCERSGEPALLTYQTLVEKPKRVLTTCSGCGDTEDVKR